MTTATLNDSIPAHLRDAETAVAAAAERVDGAWRRIDDLQARRSALIEQIAVETDDKRLEKLRRERRELAGDLEQMPHDVLGLSQSYVTALLSWSHSAWDWARGEIRTAQDERAEPAAAAARARATVDPSQPAGSRNLVAEAAAHVEINALAGQLHSLNQRIRAAENYASQVRSRVERVTGDTVNGAVATNAVPRYLASVQRRAQERAGINQ